MRAMILAAGEGSRLRPLTATRHKALLPIGDTTLLEHNIRKLVQAGVTEIVINVWYLADQIMQAIGDGARFGVSIRYSIETHGRLGTAGGIHQALPMLGDEPFWVVSADIFSEYPLHRATRLVPGQSCHLVMVPNPAFHPAGDFGLQANGSLTLQAPKYTFGSIALIHPEVFAPYAPGVYDLGLVFRELITQQRASGELFTGAWFNVGTATELQAVRAYCQSVSANGTTA